MDFHLNQPVAQLDAVTGLPNRQKFSRDYPRLRAKGASLVMVTLADARHFNEILRALGHEWSEEFICEGAGRIRGDLPAGTDLYHVSILSFAFVLLGDVTRQVRKIRDAFRAPIFCQDVPVMPRLGIGVAVCEDLGALDLLRAGLVAAQDSRGLAEGFAYYDHSRDKAHRRSFLILSQLSAALSSGDQLTLQFQPKIEFASGRVTGAEALLRWNHPLMGQISPAEFIPLAETTDHVHRLTGWVIEAALAQTAIWARDGLDLTTAINVSPHNLSQPGFCDMFVRKLHQHQVHPASVELEFTEGVLATNNETVIAELRALRSHGVNVALDDFGTGFSNLGYISRLPANIIKIDRSLITPIAVDARAATVVQALIALAHRLDYRVVAEGIETAEVYTLLKTWLCNEAQGYFLSRPLTPAAFASFIATRGAGMAMPALAVEHVTVH